MNARTAARRGGAAALGLALVLLGIGLAGPASATDHGKGKTDPTPAHHTSSSPDKGKTKTHTPPPPPTHTKSHHPSKTHTPPPPPTSTSTTPAFVAYDAVCVWRMPDGTPAGTYAWPQTLVECGSATPPALCGASYQIDNYTISTEAADSDFAALKSRGTMSSSADDAEFNPHGYSSVQNAACVTSTPPPPPPVIKVGWDVKSQCTGGDAGVAIYATNNGDTSVSLKAISPDGKSFTVAPGGHAYWLLDLGSITSPAGVVQVRAYATNGTPVSEVLSVAYDASDCTPVETTPPPTDTTSPPPTDVTTPPVTETSDTPPATETSTTSAAAVHHTTSSSSSTGTGTTTHRATARKAVAKNLASTGTPTGKILGLGAGLGLGGILLLSLAWLLGRRRPAGLHRH